MIGKPRPFVTTVVDAVTTALEAHHPGHGLSAMPRAWLAFGLTALLGTNAVYWARVERASLGIDALAALSWLFRPAQMPWERLLVARVRLWLRHEGRTQGGRVVADPEKDRAQSATQRASLHTRWDNDSGGDRLGHSLLFRLGVPSKSTLPVGVACSLPAPELTAWDQHERRLNQQGIPRQHRPPNPPPTPRDPTPPALARRLRQPGKAPYPDRTVPGVGAEALSGPGTLREGASTRGNGVQLIRQLRRNPKVRVYQREQPVAAYVATPPGTPQPLRSRGGEEVGAIRGRARLSGGAQHTTRVIGALQDAGAATERYGRASELRWRTLAIVPAHPWRGRVEVVGQDWKAHEGWGTLTTPPGEEGACRSLRLLVDPCLFWHPAQQAQRRHNLPAYTVGSLGMQVQVACLVTVLQAR